MTHSDVGSTDHPTDSTTPTYASLSDTELTDFLRTQDESAGPAALELRQRHLPAVLTCARGCTIHETAGNRLAAEAFTRAVEELRSGIDPLGTWRHHALTCVARTALLWTADGRREWLRTDFLTWARNAEQPLASPTSPSGAVQRDAPGVMLRAFYQLPEQVRGVLWYSVVDEEPDVSVARYLGIPPRTVPGLRGKAPLALQNAHAKAHLASHGTTECQGFDRIIETASHTEDTRRHPDLVAHLAGCAPCTQLLDELTRLSNEPRTALAEGLLVWGGAAYTAGRPARGAFEPSPQPRDRSDTAGDPGASPRTPTDTIQGAGTRHGSGPAHRAAPKHRALTAALAVSAAAVVAATVTNAVLDHGRPAGGSPHREPSSPPVSASRSQPPTQIRVGVTAQLVHTDSGLCLDVENERVQKHADAVAATCTSAPTQRWALDSEGRLHNMAAPDFCLKADGDAAGIGIRPCGSDDPEKQSRMMFAIGRDGVIRSRPRPDEAVVPVGTFAGEPLVLALKERTSGQAQAWAARPVPAA
ncbi:ricin-type beta-trefoil lectin domain protein [Streptomyces sp. MUM 136J]|uniref:ricin-type beta-trefoil lectin domain protein n=1 Tax=Streptomyces sp. MUM 136J TaxID=2791992 RepID=UPI001F0332AC|nr:ricin-type beta-trefoil lectin domain protein [Streptomyces sp. MUM 136J]MCH0568287.1 ricin-type beta-trefoil lectin domain protein [Streptomyces sp. MUM 136J]